jgi:hypothetical protein
MQNHIRLVPEEEGLFAIGVVNVWNKDRAANIEAEDVLLVRRDSG